MQNPRILSLLIAAVLSLTLAGCGSQQATTLPAPEPSQPVESSQLAQPSEPNDQRAPSTSAFSLADVPAYTGSASCTVNADAPYFTADDMDYAASNLGFEEYFEQDQLARCTGARACVGAETMPADGEERGGIGQVKPAGWHTATYGFVDGRYLYNRCHLIAWCLAAENANLNNLITGTRYMNVEGMLPYETQVAKYVERTGNHVLYRSTPVYEDDEQLLCKGVLIEAESVEDSGASLSLCRFCYNVQPGVIIDYYDGSSQVDPAGEQPDGSDADEAEASSAGDEQVRAYVLNTKTEKFHEPGCSAVSKMSPGNRQDVEETRSEVVSQGYEPCGICKP